MKIRKTIIQLFIFGIFYCCCQCGPRVAYNLYEEIPVIYPPLSKNEQVTLIKMSRDNSFINIDSHHFKLSGDKTGEIYWNIGTFLVEKGSEKERYDLAESNARTLGAGYLTP
ncbi:hypothetical protein CH380_13285 [Leptospira adleri]|uniref:Uncharacterized protein n=1 Tax=Leptospira adleri TaxID=2023186 RepID=A0A2M9YMI3_9LEPT|nr:hypothetical protein CH380_13285 [Leptospira adleri]PJZ61744.1 hypothetical protein CH376_11565 [Leptospira adleri]